MSIAHIYAVDIAYFVVSRLKDITVYNLFTVNEKIWQLQCIATEAAQRQSVSALPSHFTMSTVHAHNLTYFVT